MKCNDCDLVRNDQKWRFKRITIDNALTIHRVLTSKPKPPK